MQTKTISITMWAGQAELLLKAVEQVSTRAGRKVSLSEYVRAHVIPAAAADLGIAVPDFPAFEAPHFRRGAVSIAAEQMGLTVEQFKRQVAETAAQTLLARTASVSGEHRLETPMPPKTGTRG